MKTYKKILTGLTALVLIVTIGSCGGDSKPMMQDFDRANAPITITVHIYENKRQVTAAYVAFLGDEIEKDKFKDAMRDGWATWSPAGANGVPMCQIHVTKPNDVSDRTELKTWGHELAHCVYGRYHKPGEK